MDEVHQFFSARNSVNSLTPAERGRSADYLEVARAFARITYQSIYIIDYEAKAFEYVSENPLFLCGRTAAEVREMGYSFYFSNVKKEDLDLLLTINEAGFEFFDRVPLHERSLYTISYDFHILNELGQHVLINHKLTPVFLTDAGKIWKAMCIVSLSPNRNAGNITVERHGADFFWKYDPLAKTWTKEQKIILTKREKEILQLYAAGYSITQIGEQLFIAPDTVKFHRKKLFEKMEVENITEALALATNSKLL